MILYQDFEEKEKQLLDTKLAILYWNSRNRYRQYIF